MGAFAETFRVPNSKMFGDLSDTDYERAIIDAEREGRPPIREITGGQMPVQGAGDNQLHYLQSEVQRLTAENDRLREELQSLSLAHETVDRLYECSVRCVSNQIEDVKRLTAERDAARAEVKKLRSESTNIETLSEFNAQQRAAACGVKEADGVLTKTV